MQTSQEQTIQVGNLSVNYKAAGQGPVILLLHGWGSSVARWVKVQVMLAEQGYQVVVVDLPGFGKTPAPNTVWGIEEYAEFVNQFAEKLGMQEFVLVGHSFGGQIAIYFAVTYPEKVEKLIPIAAAAIRHEPSLKTKALAAIAYKTPKSIKKIVAVVTRRSDYGRARGIMKPIMKKVIEQDLTAEFKKIKVPTLIIWGDKDELTPVQDAYVMRDLIPNATLEIIPGGKHALNSQMPEKLAELICSS